MEPHSGPPAEGVSRPSDARHVWPEVERLARERFGIEEFRAGQRELIAAAVEGRDTLGILPTGAGKSLCFQLTALALPGTTIVASPLIALMQDQQEKMDRAEIPARKLDSTLTGGEEREAARAIHKGEAEIVYVTPERLENPSYLELLLRSEVELLVVDEAHCISQWGHDFRPAYLGLRGAIRQLGRPPVMALTATATPEVERDIIAQLDLRDPLVVRTSVDRPELFFEVRRTLTDEQKDEELLRLLNEEEGQGIVYTATTATADALTERLAGVGHSVVRYHGKMRATEREEAQQRFMGGEARVVVATKAFGLGIDKPDIRFVAHYHFPDSLESYYQEAGRAGRDGERARATLLYRLEDRRIQSFFLGGRYPRPEESRHAYEALRHLSRASGKGRLSEERLLKAAGLNARTGRVVVAQLESAGILERVPGQVRMLRRFDDDEELERFLNAYAIKAKGDQARLRTMMRYAQTTMCRLRFIEDYFGEQVDQNCGHCDNCASAQAHQERVPVFHAREPPRPPRATSPREEPPPPPPRKSPFEKGEQVRHAQFGVGEVLDAIGENVTVAFPRAGEKRLRANFLERLQ